MALPPQTKFIVGNEACERFSFYGMRSILMLYMTNELLIGQDVAVGISHLFLACIYILPVLGAQLADQFLGRYRCILYISLFYCLGHGVLAMADLASSLEIQRIIIFTGLGIIALGAGGIKPCVSAFVGDQMKGQDKTAMTHIYAAFYWSINLGSFFSFLVIPIIRLNYGYAWAFGVPGIFMALATLIFYLGRKQYIHTAPSQPDFVQSLYYRWRHGVKAAIVRFGADTMSKTAKTARNIAVGSILLPLFLGLAYGSYWAGQQLAIACGMGENAVKIIPLATALLYLLAVGTSALYLGCKKGAENFFGIAGSMLFNKEQLREKFSVEKRKVTRNLIRIIIIFIMIIPFWSLFEQTMSSWVLQGAKMQALNIDLSWLPGNLQLRVGAEEIQSFNPLLVMILLPTLTLLVYPYIGRWASPTKRMSIGIVLAGVSYLSVAFIQHKLDQGAQLSILWQGIPYLIITVSEIFLSTTGLEYAYTAAGKHLKSTVTSFWYLSSASGNMLVVVLSSLVSDPASLSTFLLYACLSIVTGIIFLFVTTRNKMQIEKEAA